MEKQPAQSEAKKARPRSEPTAVPAAAIPSFLLSAATSFDPDKPYRPSPGTVLQLQSRVGNRSVQRVLQRTIQCSGGDGPQGIVGMDAFDAAMEEAETRQQVSEAAATTEGQQLLALIRRHDALAFLSRLRGESEWMRLYLRRNTEFLAEMDGELQGLTRFTARTILFYGRTPPVYHIQFQRAVSERDFTRIRDLLRGYEELRQPFFQTAAMLRFELRGFPEQAEIVAIASQPELVRQEGEFYERGAHYEYPQDDQGFPQTDQPMTLQTHGDQARFELGRTPEELRVVVRIRFVRHRPGEGRRLDNASLLGREPFYPPAGLLETWRSGIESAWNNRFVATNGISRLNIVFVPVFNALAQEHYRVAIDDGADRSNVHLWYTGRSNQGTLAAHEFGHMVGNPDEYRLPATPAEIPDSMGLTPSQEQRSTYTGITDQSTEQQGAPGTTVPDSIMGDEQGPAHPRHAWPVLAHYNAHFRLPQEPPYQLE